MGGRVAQLGRRVAAAAAPEALRKSRRLTRRIIGYLTF
jgi:hypothetical protein